MTEPTVENGGQPAGIELDGIELEGASDSFGRRLARENRWTPAYAARIVREYQRFLLLARSASELISPSDPVDQAWHLHVLDTRGYRDFCRKVLGRQLDHCPSRGGSDERGKFQAAYVHTLELYRRAFGEEPPEDIWPSAAQRVEDESDYARIDVRANWILPKPRFARALAVRYHAWKVTQPRILVALPALAAVGCVTGGTAAGSISGPTFLTWFVGVWIASVVVAYSIREGWGVDRKVRETKLDAYEGAFLAGSASAAVDGALAVLVATDRIAFQARAGTLLTTRPLAPGAHPLERAIHAALPPGLPMPVRNIRFDAGKFTADIAERLHALGLISRRPSVWPLAIALIAPAIGILRIGSRIGTPHPTVWLVLLTIASTGFALLVFRPNHRTPAGEVLLRELKARHATLGSSRSAPELAAHGALPLAIGLFGIGALAPGSELGGMRRFMAKRTSNTGATCGGSCGSPWGVGAGSCGGSGHDGGGGSDGGGDGGGGGCGGCGGGGD
jgi:uncharacterized protein (TIGR04222 family)